MFLDNSLIRLGISNDSIGIIMKYDEEDQPKVAFPIIGGIEINHHHTFQN